MGMNETAVSAGKLAGQLSAAMIAFFWEPRYLFFVIGAFKLACATSVLMLPEEKIDHEVAANSPRSNPQPASPRGPGSVGDPAPVEPTIEISIDASRLDAGRDLSSGLKLLLCDPRAHYFVTTVVCVFLFHTANAAMNPLVGQSLAKGRPDDSGMLLGIMALVASEVCGSAMLMIASCFFSKDFDNRKNPLLLSFGALVLRGVIVGVILHETGEGKVADWAVAALLSTQFLDGLGDVLQNFTIGVIVRDLTAATGCFNLAVGVQTSARELGAATSNLVGEAIASHNYLAAFMTLAGIAIVPLILFGCLVPNTKGLNPYDESGNETGDARDMKMSTSNEPSCPSASPKGEVTNPLAHVNQPNQATSPTNQEFSGIGLNVQ